MDSIIASVFKATIGLLVNKGRDMMADKLKQGDATDEKFRNLIVREIDEIKSKLDGLARTNLLASISFFKEGLVYLFKVLDSVKTSEEDSKLTVQRTMGIEAAAASVKTVSLAAKMKSLQLTGQDGSTTRALSDAKDRFKQAREKATEAFCNEALSTSDRILAMQYRVMATLLEKVDNPADALAACRLCLEELHAMPAVQRSFNVQFKQGFKCRFNKAEREETIRSVCRVNRVISSVTIMIGGVMNLSLWPCVDLGAEKVDPLRDIRVTESLQEYDMELLLKQWSLVQEGEEEKPNMKSCCITSNILGQFIIADAAYLRFFDCSGKHLYSNRLQFVEAREMRKMCSVIKDIAFDRNNSVFLLIDCFSMEKDGRPRNWSTVYLCDEQGNLQHKFELKEGSLGFRITVSDNNNVFVAVRESNAQEVQVYDTKGLYINSFGKATLTGNILAMTAINSADCEIMVMTYNRPDVIVHTFSADWGADHHSHWRLSWNFPLSSIAYHRVTEHFFLLDTDITDTVRKINSSKSYPDRLCILTKDGKLVRRIHLPSKSLRNLYEQPLQTTVTNEGLVVMCAVDKRTHKRMIITLL